MKIKVDRDLCESNALCVNACPEVFEMDESDELIVLIDKPDSSLKADLQVAVNLCPRLALTIVEE